MCETFLDEGTEAQNKAKDGRTRMQGPVCLATVQACGFLGQTCGSPRHRHPSAGAPVGGGW